MIESELQAYLQTHYPRENAACEWKAFRKLGHAVSGRKGEDIASYVSAIANMEGGHLVIQFDGSKRENLDNLLLPMLPAGLTEKQKRDKVKNLLTEIRVKDQTVSHEDQGPAAVWKVVGESSKQTAH